MRRSEVAWRELSDVLKVDESPAPVQVICISR
jgi:hypothetical protein